MQCIGEKDRIGGGSSHRNARARLQAGLAALIRLGADFWLDSLFAFALFVALFSMPVCVGAPELDSSWCRALHVCFKNRAQAGSDYVFTYGPLGALLTPVYGEEIYWHKYVWEIVVNLAFTLILVLFGRRIAHKGDRFLFYAILLIYVTPGYDLRFMVSCLALAILLLVSAPRTSAFVLAGLFLAIPCLGKFTYTLFIVPAILLVTTWKWWETGRRTVLALPVAFATGVIGLWLATGQSLANLPRFVSMSLQIASGYVDAMSLIGPRSSFFLALTIFGLEVLLFIVVALYTRERVRSLVCLTLMFAALHLEFRHGFIRQDAHCLMFFGFAMAVPFFLIVIEPIFATHWGARLAIGLTLVLAAQAYQHADGLQAPDLPRRMLALYQNLRTNMRWMKHPRRHQEELIQQELGCRQLFELPRIKALVGHANIDMVSCQQAVLFLNGLHWSPRPVFQSYSAYNSELLKVNADFYTSSSAPQFVLFHLLNIDGRIPAIEDSGVLLKLLQLQLYRPVMKEKDYLLLEQRKATECTNPPSPLVTRELTTRLGEMTLVPVPLKTGTYLTATFHFRLRTSGKLLQVLYRNPQTFLVMYLSDGSLRKYRFIPDMAAHEFLLSPLLERDKDFADLYCGKITKRVVAIGVVQEDFYGLQPYHPEVRVALNAYPATFVPQVPASEVASLWHAKGGPLRMGLELLVANPSGMGEGSQGR
jgi:hypothetical protein